MNSHQVISVNLEGEEKTITVKNSDGLTNEYYLHKKKGKMVFYPNGLWSQWYYEYDPKANKTIRHDITE